MNQAFHAILSIFTSLIKCGLSPTTSQERAYLLPHLHALIKCLKNKTIICVCGLVVTTFINELQV